jgi:penicillin-binding protein 1A
MASAV